MNFVLISGRLGKDPELKTTQSGVSVASFSLAVKGYNKDETDWFNVTAWRGTAELCAKYLSKGREAIIEGSMHQRKYKAQDGSERTTWEVTADRVEFIGGKATGAGASGETQTQDGFTEVEDDDKLPF